MIDLVIPTLRCQGFADCVKTWPEKAIAEETLTMRIYPQNWHLMDKLQRGFADATAPIVGFVHDDLLVCEEGWDERVLSQLADPRVGLVGFAGALRHGSPDLYTFPYHLLPNLARGGFRSNMRDAEQHGERFTGACNVAVLDGMALFVRWKVLLEAGGWPTTEPYGYWMYSEWLCCAVRRLGYRIRLVGVAIDHLGGRTAGTTQVTDDYELAHRYFWEHNADVMPAEVQP